MPRRGRPAGGGWRWWSPQGPAETDPDAPVLVVRDGRGAAWVFDHRALAAALAWWREPGRGRPAAPPPWLGWVSALVEGPVGLWPVPARGPGVTYRDAAGRRWAFHPLVLGPWAAWDAGDRPLALADVAVTAAAGAVRVRGPRLALGLVHGREWRPLADPGGWLVLARPAVADPLPEAGLFPAPGTGGGQHGHHDPGGEAEGVAGDGRGPAGAVIHEGAGGIDQVGEGQEGDEVP
ncbi:protein of unknown function [Candidatus Hydrogenisulfobacillus filiaventi]|uniref:Uncharacterized protein n=1 Tax=Candidatus Hydrogenisulfobacillus filiaventi TaxID=2707344 RepID=A0A6F8ZFP3_9FIRM|nr:protein of unknown function [Candidatus Hydrogenisulfobacillus filiaventi]